MDFIELDGIAMMGSKKALKNKFPKVIALLYSFDCHSPIH